VRKGGGNPPVAIFYGNLKHLEQPKAFHRFLRQLFGQDWVVYAKPPFGGPEYVLPYLARYTHRVAISNHRLISLADGEVTFRWKDYAHGNQEAPNDGYCRGIPAPLSAACVAAQLCAHPPLRFACGTNARTPALLPHTGSHQGRSPILPDVRKPVLEDQKNNAQRQQVSRDPKIHDAPVGCGEALRDMPSPDTILVELPCGSSS
jgi:hypothetical protein